MWPALQATSNSSDQEREKLLLLRIAIAGLEQAQRAAADIVEGVRHHWVQALLGQAKLDDRALCRGEIDRLRAPVTLVALLQHDAFFDHRIKDCAYDMERAVDARAGVQHEYPHPLAHADLQRVIFVLVGH